MSRLPGCGMMRRRIIMGEYSLRDRGRKTRRRVNTGFITTAIVWPEARRVGIEYFDCAGGWGVGDAGEDVCTKNLITNNLRTKNK